MCEGGMGFFGTERVGGRRRGFEKVKKEGYGK
jgi:hypothetical protein